MVVNDPLSAVLTLEGWYIANKIMIVLNQTNILMFMLTVIVFQVWVDVAQEGEDEGNKGLLGLNRTEVKMMISGLVCFLSVLPLFPVNVNTLTFDQSASETCGVGISDGATHSDQSTLNGEEVVVPIWWALWHSLSQGMTNAAVSSIPCHYDIERSMLKLSQADIQSEPIRQE
ncbi:conjugal transfer protein TraG N-terminal domain-containing protein, partial [Vibrio parahaemolyticus]|nr:conjugal transfer protein TraG N-terminal domain-containing protein [Vibrio parahaemolyticus]